MKNSDYIFNTKFLYSKKFYADILVLFSTVKILKSRKGGVVAHERLTEPRATIEGLLAKPRSFSNLHPFWDLYDIINLIDFCNKIFRDCFSGGPKK